MSGQALVYNHLSITFCLPSYFSQTWLKVIMWSFYVFLSRQTKFKEKPWSRTNIFKTAIKFGWIHGAPMRSFLKYQVSELGKKIGYDRTFRKERRKLFVSDRHHDDRQPKTCEFFRKASVAFRSSCWHDKLHTNLEQRLSNSIEPLMPYYFVLK